VEKKSQIITSEKDLRVWFLLDTWSWLSA